jgi:hypothetical protein
MTALITDQVGLRRGLLRHRLLLVDGNSRRADLVELGSGALEVVLSLVERCDQLGARGWRATACEQIELSLGAGDIDIEAASSDSPEVRASGGRLELSVLNALEVVEEVACHDGSTGRVVGLGVASALLN